MHVLAFVTNYRARLIKYCTMTSPINPQSATKRQSLFLYRSAYQSPLCFFAYFFLPFLLLVEPPAEVADATLEALDGVAELFLLDLTDLTLSSALF